MNDVLVLALLVKLEDELANDVIRRPVLGEVVGPDAVGRSARRLRRSRGSGGFRLPLFLGGIKKRGTLSGDRVPRGGLQ
ncbi:MAG: hypothetical protein AB7U20_10105 [Planctomycetaceae bacterium]